jgi:hypothetical protein
MIPVGVETSPRKVFAWAADWPGWCRAGRDRDLALEALAAYGSRYTPVAAAAGHELPAGEFEVIAVVEGDSGTAFGVPSMIIDDDRRPVTAAEAGRLASLVKASWAYFDQVAAAAPAELRKGPRGGGRDTAKIVEHVDAADSAYAREIGIRAKPPTNREVTEAMRREMLAVLAAPSDGSPLAGRKWTLRYAARRIAWHALDHAWEIEDRSQPS